ncbi:MAG: hypothetical protein KDC35_13750 [Acidobacteria bacterium]|nr:hypothetical protein [Acidobacteriota bacterium]
MIGVQAYGLCLPGGLSIDDLFMGQSALVRLPDDYPVVIGAPVTESLPTLDKCFGIQPRAAQLALSAVERLGDVPADCGLVLGMSSLFSEPEYLAHAMVHRNDCQRMSEVLGFGGDHVLHELADTWRITGPRLRVDSACASGADALIVACEWIRHDYVDRCLVVASAAMLNPIGLAVFKNLKALSTDDDLGASRPFDRRRKGFVMGEGAAAVLLERGQGACFSVQGWGQSMNGYKFTDMPEDLSAMSDAVRQAMGMGLDQVTYVSAHGTGTPSNDRAETMLHRLVFGKRAIHVPISAIKSMTGHCLGASSLIEIVVAGESVKRQMAPPTINLDVPDPACDLNYVARHAIPLNPGFALSQSFAFGGHNVAVMVSP